MKTFPDCALTPAVGLVLLLVAPLGAAQSDPALRSDAGYAWPRADQIVLDGPWSLAWTDPPAEAAKLPDLDRLDRLTVSFGIRTVERRLGPMQRTSYEAREWIFHVNGKPMFVKGTNWMPIDALADVDPECYEWHLAAARDAGVQMIRIWCGGRSSANGDRTPCPPRRPMPRSSVLRTCHPCRNLNNLLFYGS